MLPKFLVACVALISSSVFANTLDFYAGVRRADVNDVKWKGTEYGFSYLLDINDILSVGPYLTSSAWNIHNDALQTDSKADHRELGPEARVVIPLETVNFMAGATYSLVSKGTAETEDGMTADVTVEGFRFKIGVEFPIASGLGLNVGLIKGVQTVEIKNDLGKGHDELDDLALSFGLTF